MIVARRSLTALSSKALTSIDASTRFARCQGRSWPICAWKASVDSAVTRTWTSPVLQSSEPDSAVVVMLALALGLGASTALFSVVNAVLLRPLPLERDDELVLLYATNPDKSIPRFGV